MRVPIAPVQGLPHSALDKICHGWNKQEFLNRNATKGLTRDERMSELKKCPKCKGIMVEGTLSVQHSAYKVNWKTGRWSVGENVVAYRCQDCGYAELYSTEFR